MILIWDDEYESMMVAIELESAGSVFGHPITENLPPTVLSCLSVGLAVPFVESRPTMRDLTLVTDDVTSLRQFASALGRLGPSLFFVCETADPRISEAEKLGATVLVLG